MKIISFNVNGIRAAHKKGLGAFIKAEGADIFAVQETKCQEGQSPTYFNGSNVLFCSAQKPGYSGVAVASKIQPISQHLGFFLHPDNDLGQLNNEGRLITLEFEKFYFVCVYTPNSQEGLKRLEERTQWDKEFRQHVIALDDEKPVIITGDMNVAHNEIDIANPASNHLNPGFSDQERANFSELLNSGFSDTFRSLYPDKVEYSWFSYRFNARERGIGWRIDYFLVSNRILSKVNDSLILTSSAPMSDHIPICLDIDL